MVMQAAMRNSALDVVPLTGNVGAEILNIDLTAPQPDHVWEEIFATFSRWGVVFFRDQGHMTPAQLKDFAARFGTISHSRLIKDMDGMDAIGEVRKEPDQREAAGNRWHTDQSARQHPVRGTLLLGREIPKSGGDTCFISMATAYDALSDGLKRTLESLSAIHSEASVYEIQASGSDAFRFDASIKPNEAVHPVVIRLPESGKKALYVNPGKTVRFDGWTAEESRVLLDYLYAHVQKPEFACRFRWREGSLAFWDNYQTWHYAVNDYHGQRRLMHRTMVVAEIYRDIA